MTWRLHSRGQYVGAPAIGVRGCMRRAISIGLALASCAVTLTALSVAEARLSPASAETGAGTSYVAVAPCRVLDTRAGAVGAFGSGQTRSFQVAGTGGMFGAQGGKPNGCSVPEDATAVEASVTAVVPSSPGFARLWPAGSIEPQATFLNFTVGQSITNTGAISLSAAPGIADLSLRNYAVRSDYVVDIQGYFTNTGAGASYVAVRPCRVLDTRAGVQGRFAAGQLRSFQVAGTGAGFSAQGGKLGGCSVPENATAVEASVTAVDPTGTGFARLWPAGSPEPTATFLNFTKGQAVTNTGTIPLSPTAGTADVSLRSHAPASDYVMDIQGYFTKTGAGASYVAVTPCRVFDSRINVVGPFGSGSTLFVRVRGSGGIFGAQGGKPNGCSVPEDAIAVEASVTAVVPSSAGFARLWPGDSTEPQATFLNFAKDQSITNTGAIPLSAAPDTTDVFLRNYSVQSDYVVDIQGYFTTP